jgi:uncharacterized protein YqcC (DUF446 family)
MNQIVRVTQILDQLELELTQRSLWQATPPPIEAMASTLPFCMDTLEFHQWLQFVLIVRLRQMILLQMDLPAQSALYPMATEVYKQTLGEHHSLIESLVALDEALTGYPVVRQP